MKQGHNDIARIYAQNAVRKQQEKLNLLQLASRVDAVAGRVQTAVTMRQITGNMMKVNRSLDVAMKSMSPERVQHHIHALRFHPQRLTDDTDRRRHGGL